MSVLDRYRQPGYRRLLAAARRSLERSGGDLSGTVSVSAPDDAERRAIIGITGAFRPAGVRRLTVRLADLDGTLREDCGLGLAEALSRLDGVDVRDRPAERAARIDRRAALLDGARRSVLHQRAGWFQDWLVDMDADGTVTRLANLRDEDTLPRAVRVLEYLSRRDNEPPIPLPALAQATTGDTKVLNKGTLPTLVLRALASRAGVTRPSTAEGIRQLWDRFDVIVDDLASRVLVLNLPAAGAGLAEWLTDAARYGTPFQVTLHQLVAHPPRPLAEQIYVCENPAVLRRAADELGPRCPPLVCGEGRPSAAFHRLMLRSTEAGARLCYHGDFDWPGVEIATAVMARHRGLPWRLTAADYAEAAGSATPGRASALSGPPRDTPWDPELSATMRRVRVAVYEEAVADSLLEDLARASGHR